MKRILIFNSTSGAFTPPIANLAAHWDCSVASSVHISTGVSQWDDLSGNNRHLLQATGSQQPTYSGSGTTSKIVFNRASIQFMNASWTQNQPVTIYAVMQQDNWSTNDGVWDGLGSNTMLLRQHSSTPNIAQYAGSAFGTDNPDMTLSSTKVLVAIYDGASSLLNVNSGTPTTGSIGTSSPGGFSIGASGSGGLPSSITVKEIYYYSTNHNSIIQGNMVTYLRTIWGI